MKTLVDVSLAKEQGKTLLSLLLGRLLANRGQKVLMVDADPQANLTFYLGHDVQASEPTLLEVLKGQGVHPSLARLRMRIDHLGKHSDGEALVARCFPATERLKFSPACQFA